MKEQTLSFRFKQETIEKLEKIRQYHQSVIDDVLLPSSDFVLSKTAIIEGTIHQTYQDMVLAGLIKEE